MIERTKILLAEDEPSLAQIVQESLESRGYEVTHCINGADAYEVFQKTDPELLVLDVMMPKMDGFTLAKEIRLLNQDIPIIFLTAKSQTRDVVEGFNLGGNDYLKKPFSMEELIVRIENLLQHLKPSMPVQPLAIGRFVFDPKMQTLKLDSQTEVTLTHREAQLLLHLNNAKNDVLERSYILKKLWHNDDFFSARSMDVFISRLRKKLKADPNVQIINVRGYGYKLIC